MPYVAEVETVRFRPNPVAQTVWLFFKDGKRRLVYGNPEAPLLVLVDDGNSLYFGFPRQRFALRYAPIRQRFLLGLLRRNYLLRLQGEEIVAGRPCYVLLILPKHKGNPIRKLWVDKQHFIIMRDEWQRPDGNPVQQTFVRSLTFPPNLDDALFVVPNEWRVVNTAYQTVDDLSLAEQLVGFTVRLPRFLPVGYQLSRIGVTYCRNGAPVVHLQYSDGMNTISIFEHPIPCRPRRQFRFRRGWQGQLACEWLPPVEASVAKTVDNLRVVVLGHPLRTVMERIAESLSAPAAR